MTNMSVHHTKHREGRKQPTIEIDFNHPLVEKSIVRHNLLTRDGYAPYCGSVSCMNRVPYNMTTGVATCSCGWVSLKLPTEFINLFNRVWGL